MALSVSALCLRALGISLILGLFVRCDDSEVLCGAYSPGDIIIGILGSVHSKVKDLQARIRPNKYTCADFDLIPFVESLAVIHTIESINDSGFLPGIRLGYHMCDSCAYSTKALQCVEQMLSMNGSLPVHADYSEFSSPVKAFLGERYSELSIPVAKYLSMYMIPQISCTSSSPLLSDKLRCASFFRVIPSDTYQTKALARFMNHFNWDWIGVVTLDDEYGKSALENFLLHAGEEHICIDFQEVVPYNLDDNSQQRIKEVAHRIRSSSVKVVLLILRSELVEMLFGEMIKTNTTRIWIASDAWSAMRNLMKMKDINQVGEIFGFTFLTGKIPGFKDYLQNLTIRPGVRNDYIGEYKQIRFNCSQQSEHTSPSACNVTDPQEMNDDYLLHAVDLREIYNQRVAMYALAHGLKKLLKCNDTACSGDTDFQPWKLMDNLHLLNFTVDSQTYAFNEKGDFENGYDLIRWKMIDDGRELEVVGKFLIKNESINVYQDKIPWSNNTVPLARCSEPCAPGTVKNMSRMSCCYNCTNCGEGYFSENLDQTTCQKCPNGTWSLPGSSQCQVWNVWYLEWSSAYSIVVIIGTVIGIVLLVFSFIFFIHHREKPIIKDFFIISCLMKLGLLVSFGSVIVFLGRPTKPLCMAQQAMYALGFTLCVSCILAKAFNTLVAFMAFNPDRQRTLRKLEKPFVIISFLTLGQALISIFWLIFDPLNAELTFSKSQPLTKNLLCTQGSMYGFGAMHVYIALLAVICFLMAFKGRDNETEPIVFSMLIHLFAWLCFIPVFITQVELRPIVQISAIMVSNYGVIFCHFTPKWYKILVEKAKIQNKVKSLGSLPPHDHDSGVGNDTIGNDSEASLSMHSFPQAQFDFEESEISEQSISEISDNTISEISNHTISEISGNTISEISGNTISEISDYPLSESDVRRRRLRHQRARSF